MSKADLYERDFYAWLMQNAALIREGRLSEIDCENLVEELESMGRSERHELTDRLAVLLAHLLKWQYQPARRGNSWRATIKEQRRRVLRRLTASPSLKHNIQDTLAEAYEDAVLLAVGETGLDETVFLSTCPFTLEQVLDTGFWPDTVI